ncbi:MAG: GDSL-type esterase/lipase family protein [Bowdeniella nasicola]|nr:GDSL-type esterase/lipase family protein [Bowdeniella nasicola]
MRIFVIGDELAAGLGDARYLGWVGRVAARSELATPAYLANLAIPGASTSSLAGGWRSEIERRLATGDDCRLVVGLGIGDLREGLSTARSRLNLANLLDGASRLHLPTFVMGPPPLHTTGDIATLSDAYADVCARRHVPFVHTYRPLITHEQWLTDVAHNDGSHPGQLGYGLLAWLALNQGWCEWVGSGS